MLLAAQSMTPNALAEHFDTSRQAVSKHLQVLAECELVKQKQDGREIHYQLNANKMQEIEKWLQRFKAVLNKKFSQLDEVLEQIKKQRKK